MIYASEDVPGFGRTLTSAWIETSSPLELEFPTGVALSRVRGLKL